MFLKLVAFTHKASVTSVLLPLMVLRRVALRNFGYFLLRDRKLVYELFPDLIERVDRPSYNPPLGSYRIHSRHKNSYTSARLSC